MNSKFIGPLGTTSEPRRIDADDAAPVTPPPFIPGPPPRPGPPSFRIVKTENRKFRPAKASTPPRLLASISKKLPSGTVFTYELTADAAVTVEMRRLKAGRTVGKKCKPRNRANVSKKKCDLVEHKLWRSGRAGVNELPYTGKVKGKVLKPGRYKAVFTAANAGGSRSASVGFTLVK